MSAAIPAVSNATASAEMNSGDAPAAPEDPDFALLRFQSVMARTQPVKDQFRNLPKDPFRPRGKVTVVKKTASVAVAPVPAAQATNCPARFKHKPQAASATAAGPSQNPHPNHYSATVAPIPAPGTAAVVPPARKPCCIVQ